MTLFFRRNGGRYQLPVEDAEANRFDPTVPPRQEPINDLFGDSSSSSGEDDANEDEELVRRTGSKQRYRPNYEIFLAGDASLEEE